LDKGDIEPDFSNIGLGRSFSVTGYNYFPKHKHTSPACEVLSAVAPGNTRGSFPYISN